MAADFDCFIRISDRSLLHVCYDGSFSHHEKWRDFFQGYITGPPNGPVLFYTLSSVVVCNARGRSAAAGPGEWPVRRPTLHGGTVRLRPVRATSCFRWQFKGIVDDIAEIRMELKLHHVRNVGWQTLDRQSYLSKNVTQTVTVFRSFPSEIKPPSRNEWSICFLYRGIRPISIPYHVQQLIVGRAQMRRRQCLSIGSICSAWWRRSVSTGRCHSTDPNDFITTLTFTRLCTDRLCLPTSITSGYRSRLSSCCL